MGLVDRFLRTETEDKDVGTEWECNHIVFDFYEEDGKKLIGVQLLDDLELVRIFTGVEYINFLSSLSVSYCLKAVHEYAVDLYFSHRVIVRVGKEFLESKYYYLDVWKKMEEL